MSNKHGKSSDQFRKHLQGGELVLKELEDDEIDHILEVGESSVKQWRQELQANNELSCFTRNKYSVRPDPQEIRRIIRAANWSRCLG